MIESASALPSWKCVGCGHASVSAWPPARCWWCHRPEYSNTEARSLFVRHFGTLEIERARDDWLSVAPLDRKVVHDVVRTRGGLEHRVVLIGGGQSEGRGLDQWEALARALGIL